MRWKIEEGGTVAFSIGALQSDPVPTHWELGPKQWKLAIQGSPGET